MSFIDYDIKIKVTPEQSRKVQRICFENGIGWGGSDRYRVQLTNTPHLFIYPNKESAIRWGDNVDNFEDSPNQLVDAEKFIEFKGIIEKIQQTEQIDCTNNTIFEIIEPTPDNKIFIKTLNQLFEKYKGYSIEVQYNTTYVNKFYKGALLIITPFVKNNITIN